MAVEKPTQLSLLDHASQLLADARTLEDMIQVRSVAEAARVYARAAKLGLELQNRAAEIKLRAERRAGHVVAGLRLRGGDRKSKGPRVTLKLSELGITRQQSKRWQTLAAISEQEFNYFVESTAALHQEITASALLKLATKPNSLRRRSQQVTSARSASHLTSTFDLLSLVDELRNHHQLLSQMLGLDGPIRIHEKKASAARIVSHLLEEINTTLRELEALTKRLSWLETVNQMPHQ